MWPSALSAFHDIKTASKTAFHSRVSVSTLEQAPSQNLLDLQSNSFAPQIPTLHRLSNMINKAFKCFWIVAKNLIYQELQQVLHRHGLYNWCSRRKKDGKIYIHTCNCSSNNATQKSHGRSTCTQEARKSCVQKKFGRVRAQKEILAQTRRIQLHTQVHVIAKWCT